MRFDLKVRTESGVHFVEGVHTERTPVSGEEIVIMSPDDKKMYRHIVTRVAHHIRSSQGGWGAYIFCRFV